MKESTNIVIEMLDIMAPIEKTQIVNKHTIYISKVTKNLLHGFEGHISPNI